MTARNLFRSFIATGLTACALASAPTPVAPSPPQIVYPDSPLLAMSPSNWMPYTHDGHAAISAVYAGSYVRAKFNGNSLTIGVDTSGNTHYCFTFVECDANEPRLAQMTPGQNKIVIDGLAPGDHEIQVTLFARHQAHATWNGSQALKITSFMPAGGTGMLQATARPKRMILFGDSITEGLSMGDESDPHFAVTDSGYPNPNNTAAANYTYAHLLGLLLNTEFDQAGFGGTNWSAGSGTDAPSLESAYAFNQNGSPRNAAAMRAMDYVTINLGTNGVPLVADVSRVLGKIRIAYPNAIIFVFALFSHHTPANSNLQAGLSDYLATHPAESKMCYVDPGVLAGSAGPAAWWTSLDIHPSPGGHARVAAAYGQQMLVEIAKRR